MFESDSLRRREDSDFFLGNGSSCFSLVRIVRYTSQASCLVRGLSWSERFFEIPLCQDALLNPMINWITLELMVVTRSFNVVLPSAARGRARLPACLHPLRVEKTRRLLFCSPSGDGDSTLLDLYPDPDVSDRLLFRQESVGFSGSDGFGGIFVCVSLMHSTSSNKHTFLPGVVLVVGVGNGRFGMVS